MLCKKLPPCVDRCRSSVICICGGNLRVFRHILCFGEKVKHLSEIMMYDNLGNFNRENGRRKNMAEFKTITMDAAKKIFAEAGDYIILDVRRADEFAQGHIPGAVNVANEDIGAVRPAELPEITKQIYVYCRSGRRSADASAKLAALGYTNIINCGGILDWTGELEKK